jgi:phosphoribosylanthranilate isomerase
MNPRFVELERVGVKICGFTSRDNALAVAELGADALGFNFWPKSKRYLEPAQFEAWARDLPDGIDRVGVFVNAERELVTSLLESGALHAAQFHGDETIEYCSAFAGKFPFLRAFGVRSPESLDGITSYGTNSVLLDAYCPGEYGGSGEAFDWALGQQFVDQHPDFNVVLAGGLTPESVAGAVAGVRPAAVDVASCVESAPGVKDLDLVRRFIAKARGK